jgi:hypothetical protein
MIVIVDYCELSLKIYSKFVSQNSNMYEFANFLKCWEIAYSASVKIKRRKALEI